MLCLKYKLKKNINPDAVILTIDSKASESKATELEIKYATSLSPKIRIAIINVITAFFVFSIVASHIR